MVKYWHFNCSTETNKNHMLNRNMSYICLGFNNLDYINGTKKAGTTFKQLENFKNKSDIGDIILLYQSKVGYVAYGKYNGEISKPKSRDEEAPDWPHNAFQEHIGIDKWINISNPNTKYFFRPTLCMIQKNKEEIFNYVINQ